MGENIDIYYEFALQLVKESGKIMKEAKDITVKTKKDETDLVTQYDKQVENNLVLALQTRFPTHKFISEENAFENQETLVLTDEPTWIIDPIDGTSNFIRKIPFVCISVGLTVNKTGIIGIVYNPFLDELFTAIRGKGAFLNGAPIHTNSVQDIKKSIYTCELSLGTYQEYTDSYIYRVKHLLPQVQGFRSFGCAALSLCYVAAGIFEVYQVDGLFPWDAAAGAVIVREAGGYLSQANGLEFDVMKPSVIATSTRILSDQYTQIIRKADEERLNAQKVL